MMSIIQDLYDLYDREYARYRKRRSSQHRLLIEIRENLAFLREGLREGLAQQVLIDGLENSRFRAACDDGIDLDRLQPRPVDSRSFGGIREFYRYEGWSTARLVETAYERIATLQKLSPGAAHVDLGSRLRNLFKLLMLVLAHVEDHPLPQRRRA